VELSQYRIEAEDDHILVDGRPLVFHHYQGFWLSPRTAFGRLLTRTFPSYRQSATRPAGCGQPRWPLSELVLDVIWEPYVERIAEAMTELVAVGAPADLGAERCRRGGGRSAIKPRLPRLMRRTYWRMRFAARQAERAARCRLRRRTTPSRMATAAGRPRNRRRQRVRTSTSRRVAANTFVQVAGEVASRLFLFVFFAIMCGASVLPTSATSRSPSP